MRARWRSMPAIEKLIVTMSIAILLSIVVFPLLPSQGEAWGGHVVSATVTKVCIEPREGTQATDGDMGPFCFHRGDEAVKPAWPDFERGHCVSMLTKDDDRYAIEDVYPPDPPGAC